MRVGIDLTAIWRPLTGMERVAIEMTRALLRLDQENEYVLFFSEDVHPAFADARGDFQPVIFPVRGELLSKNVFFAFSPAVSHLDFLHFPVFPPPLWCRCPHGWTVHDATPWLYPETMKRTSRLYFQALGGHAMRTSQLLVTDSHSSRKDLQRLFGGRRDDIRVIDLAVRSNLARVEDPTVLRRLRQKYSLPQEFLLCVATLEPRKNLSRLLGAFQSLRESGRTAASLVIVGREGWLYDRIFAEILAAGLRDEVIFTGHVADEDLAGLYSLARAFVYPSLYEGFGLPCIEAMACGCPVVTSNRGALLEVTGQAAVHADPEDLASIASAIERILRDESLRQTLVERGLERAKLFTWDRYAYEMMKAFEDTAERAEAFAGS
ncbi:MAG: glycosyltransferase family 1 protein [Candidatus Acidiferrales bacterium]